MKKAIFEFQFLTPAILAGANQTTAEMRIPSLRGALRWWTRFLAGEEIERDIFGYVQGKKCQPSKVILRLLKSINNSTKPDQDAVDIIGNKFDYFLWPLNPPKTNKQAGAGDMGNERKRGVIQPGAKYTVAVQVKAGHEDDESIVWLEFIIKAFLLFGSLGTRSRRAYGSVWPVSAEFDAEEWDIPQTVDELIYEANSFLYDNSLSIYRLADSCRDYKQAINKCSDFLKNIRCGKSAHGNTASEWGKNDHDAGLQNSGKIYRAALGLPLTQTYSSSHKKVDYSINDWDRMASPLHFKVIKLNNKFVPLMLVIPEYVPSNGTKVKAMIKKGGTGTFELQLDTELLEILCNEAESLGSGLNRIAQYPIPEEDVE